MIYFLLLSKSQFFPFHIPPFISLETKIIYKNALPTKQNILPLCDFFKTQLYDFELQ